MSVGNGRTDGKGVCHGSLPIYVEDDMRRSLPAEYVSYHTLRGWERDLWQTSGVVYL